MKIGIIGSMQFTDKLFEVKNKLQELGHEAFITSLAQTMINKSNKEIEIIKLN